MVTLGRLFFRDRLDGQFKTKDMEQSLQGCQFRVALVGEKAIEVFPADLGGLGELGVIPIGFRHIAEGEEENFLSESSSAALR